MRKKFVVGRQIPPVPCRVHLEECKDGVFMIAEDGTGHDRAVCKLSNTGQLHFIGYNERIVRNVPDLCPL